MSSSLLLLLGTLAFFSCSDMASSADPPLTPKGENYEVSAWMSVKMEMRDETGPIVGWDINSVDPCIWSMVACCPQGFVVSLEMASNSLSGTLSPSIGNLSHLQSLLLQNNKLSGPIPTEIGILLLLKTIDLSGNQFCWLLDRNNLSGQIPQAIANLKNHAFLDLSFNNLCGSTPKVLAKGYREFPFFRKIFLLHNPGISFVLHDCTDVPLPVNETCTLDKPNRIHELDIGHLKRNLLRLYGFCMTANEGLLVYPYMLNGSVADRLRDCVRGKLSLDWSKWMRIALGAARGLLYLHEQCNPKIIHRDVKAANILLDEYLEAVVGDFGLARLLDRRDSHDLFSLKTALLDKYSGAICPIVPRTASVRIWYPTPGANYRTQVIGLGNGQKGMILDWVKSLHKEKRLNELVDKDLNGSFAESELESAVTGVLLCTRSNPALRPKMSEVLKALDSVATQTEHLDNGEMLSVRSCSFSTNYEEANKASSFIREPIELSGPR